MYSPVTRVPYTELLPGKGWGKESVEWPERERGWENPGSTRMRTRQPRIWSAARARKDYAMRINPFLSNPSLLCFFSLTRFIKNFPLVGNHSFGSYSE